MCNVDWVNVASTAVGAAIALIGTVLANTLGNRGQRERDNRADRRQSYLDFLLALNGAHAQLRLVASNPDVADFEYETQQALSVNRVYEGREKMLMSANRSVLAAGERSFMCLVRLRQAVNREARVHTVEYHEAYHAYANALWDLRRVLREDLGNGGLTPADLDRAAWDGRETCAFCQANAATPTPTSAPTALSSSI
ncbi:MAG: hypothetical protein QOE61_4481 [Micromonosporaceae bacterium]|nr:hypothetical protein [Micromonosporaceae bacterium]